MSTEAVKKKGNSGEDFTQGSIPVKLVKFMFPILGALILQAMYGAVDLLIVGWFGTTAGISAVSTGSNIVNLIVFTLAGLAMGITVLISQYMGQKRADRISDVIGGIICFFLAVSVVISVIMLVFAPQIVSLMQAPEEARELTVLYVRICGGGIVFVIGYNVISSVFRGLGNSKLPLLFVAIACVTNIVGDLILVAGFHMNVAGAAIATIAAQAVSVILSLFIIMRQKLPFTMTRQNIRFNREVVNFLRMGAPIALQELLTNITFLALCSFINNLGLAASSGYGVANKISSFIMLIPSSLMQSMSSFVGQNVGAGKEDRARGALYSGIAIGGIIGIPVFFMALLNGALPASIFTGDAAVVEQAAAYLRGFSVEAIVTSISFSFMGYFNGHGETVFVMAQGLAQSFLVRLPLSYLMSIRPNTTLTLIGIAAPSATIFGILLELVYYVIFIHRKNSATKNGAGMFSRGPKS